MTRTVVGLDIGGSGVRAAEVEIGRRATLRRFAAVTLPEGVIRSGLILDPDELAAALRKLWVQGRFSTRHVVVGIANSGVLVRQMDLDWMPPEDFRKALRYQVADALPVPVDEANLDYYLLDEIEPGPEDLEQRKIARVMLVAAGREMVDSFVHAVTAAGLFPDRVDLLPFAMVRAASPVAGLDSPLEAIVDIGADNVVVVVHQGGRPRFVRTLSGHGGQAITHALVERYDWTWEEAERTKIAVGLADQHPRVAPNADEGNPVFGSAELVPSIPAVPSHPAQGVVAEQVDALAAELNATLDYFRTSTDEEATLTRLLLTGLGADLGGLDDALEAQLEIPVEHLSVLGQLRTSRRMVLAAQEELALAVPVGLCLGAAS